MLKIPFKSLLKFYFSGRLFGGNSNASGPVVAESKFPETDERIKTLKFSFGMNSSDATFGWNGFHNTFSVYYKHPDAMDVYLRLQKYFTLIIIQCI